MTDTLTTDTALLRGMVKHALSKGIPASVNGQFPSVPQVIMYGQQLCLLFGYLYTAFARPRSNICVTCIVGFHMYSDLRQLFALEPLAQTLRYVCTLLSVALYIVRAMCAASGMMLVAVPVLTITGPTYHITAYQVTRYVLVCIDMGISDVCISIMIRSTMFS